MFLLPFAPAEKFLWFVYRCSLSPLRPEIRTIQDSCFWLLKNNRHSIYDLRAFSQRYLKLFKDDLVSIYDIIYPTTTTIHQPTLLPALTTLE